MISFTAMRQILVHLPCHHPAWPRWCPRCRARVDGFNVSMRVEVAERLMGRTLDTPAGPGPFAWGTNGSACLTCLTWALPDATPREMRETLSEAVTRALCITGGYVPAQQIYAAA